MAITKNNTRMLDGSTVLQVQQGTFTTAFESSASAGWNDLGLSVTITPSSTSSKILIAATLGTVDHSQDSYVLFFKYVRGSTDVGVGDANGARTRCSTAIRGTGSGNVNANSPVTLPDFLDSPNTTSATTYKIQFNNYDSSGSSPFYVNRQNGDGSNGAYGSFISTITAIEIGG